MINIHIIITIANIALFIALFIANDTSANKRRKRYVYKREILTDRDFAELLKQEADFINSHEDINIISIERETYYDYYHDYPYDMVMSMIKYKKEI